MSGARKSAKRTIQNYPETENDRKKLSGNDLDATSNRKTIKISVLRKQIKHLPEQLQDKQLRTYFASTNLCTDNAAMIAYTGCQYLLNNQQDKNLKINIIPRWSVEDITYAN